MLLKLKRRKLNKPAENQPNTRLPGRGWRRLVRFLFIFPLVLFAIGLTAYFVVPIYLLKNINEKVGNMPGYTAHIESLDINFFTATAVAQNIIIKKRGSKIDVPVLYVNKSTVRLDKGGYAIGKYYTSIVVDSISINVIKGPTAELSQGPGDTTLTNLLEVLMPLKRNRLEILHADLHYTDNSKLPALKIDIHQLYILGENLANVIDSTAQYPGKLLVKGNVYGGELLVKGKVNAMSKKPMFNLDMTINGLPLVNINSYLRTYAKFDVQKGIFNMTAHLEANNNHIKGYAKPEVKGLDVYDRKTEKGENNKTKNREKWIDFGAWLFKNKKEDRLSAEIILDGTLDNPHINSWDIIDKAINSGVQKSILSGSDVSLGDDPNDKDKKKGFLGKLFGGKKAREERKKDRQEKKDKK